MRTLSIGVLDVDVVEFGVCSAVLDGSGGFIVGGSAEEGGAVGDDDDVFGVGTGVFGVAVDCQGGFAGGDDDLF